MKRNILLILLWLSFCGVYGQVILKGAILDSTTGEPVDYVNIGLVEKAQGTVSDMDGLFELAVIGASRDDIVRISRIGYKPLEYSLEDLVAELKKTPTLLMSVERTALDEVVISQKDAEKNRIGINNITLDLVAYWNNRNALGGEHASKILVRKGPVKLEDLSFHIIRNISDSLLVRVNIYEIDKGLPGRNIARENILYTIKKRSGRVIIDLSPYDIVVDDHFIISLEMLKVYGDKVGMTIAAYHDGYRSYSRLISQDRWRRMRKGFTIAFNLNTSEVENVDGRSKKSKKLPKPDLVNLYWDNSLSMEGRDLEKEFEYLDLFFKKLGNSKVEFQTFGYNLGKAQRFEIKNGRWEPIKKQILSSRNDGAVRRQVLEGMNPQDFSLIFTDGLDFHEDIQRNWSGRVYAVNSSTVSNADLLAEIAYDTGGDFINLAERHDLERAADYKRMQGNHVSRSWQKDMVQIEYKTIRGNVSDYEDNLEKVLVQVKNSDRKTRTDVDGNFEIQALPGETLAFSYPGRITIEALVNPGTNFLTIAMPLGVKVLDEVVVKKRAKEAPVSIGVYGEKEKVTTNFGVIDPATSGFAVKQIKGENLFAGSTNLAEALSGKFSGVTVVRDYSGAVSVVGRNGTGPQRTGRPRNMFNSYVPKVLTRSGFAAWDIDGSFYTPDNFPDNIPVQNIKTITIMPGSWAASKYGKEANGGIVIVRTINNNFDDLEARKDPLEDQARLKDNFYQEDAVFPEENPENLPIYIQELYSSNTEAEAYSQYLNQRSQWKSSPDYLVDIHDYFLSNWNARRLGGLILSGIRELNNNDVNALRLLAYKYDERGDYSESLDIYRQIALQATDQLQSIRDLAKALSRTGKFKESWTEYNRYLTMKSDSLNTKGLDKIVRQEMLELVQNHAESIELERSRFNFDQDVEDISIVVQWNNPNAEFELQFVGPTGQYYTWKHTEVDNMLLLTEERIDGSYSKSFSIEDIGEGPWKINSKYIGNKEGTPTYLKFTFTNNQISTDTTKVLKLRKSNINYRSFDISQEEVTPLFK